MMGHQIRKSAIHRMGQRTTGIGMIEAIMQPGKGRAAMHGMIDAVIGQAAKGIRVVAA
jgi:hypothetical protein